MIHRPELLERLESTVKVAVDGRFWRHVFGAAPPDRENTTGARWNPPGVAAIYLSLTRDGAIAEGDHAQAVQPLRPRARRRLYAVELTLRSVVDMTAADALEAVGLSMSEIAADDHAPCREVGAAVDWLEHDGLLVPSARSASSNLVVYPARRAAAARFNFDDGEELATA